MLLNYIWAGLIIISLVFALTSDTLDIVQDTYRNEEALPLELVFPNGFDPEARRQPVQVRVDPEAYQTFYRTEATPETSYVAVMIFGEGQRQVRFDADASLPEPLATIRDVTNPRDKQLQGIVVDRMDAREVRPRPPPLDAVRPGEEDIQAPGDVTPIDEEDLPGPVGPDPPRPEDPDLTPEELQALLQVDPDDAEAETFDVTMRFEPVHFVNMNRIASAALDFATTAAEIALGLIGILALFLGLLKIGEEAGVIRAMTRFVRPVLKPLFPQIPDDHPAFSVIALNMAANIFGLGNAATPFGIKAMEELQTLNPTEDTATDPMVMLLAVNTASVQLVPPVLLIALMGLQINELIFAIIITTGISLIVAITAAKLLGRLPGYRASDPTRTVPPEDLQKPPPDSTPGA
jgi:spore maturation protein A